MRGDMRDLEAGEARGRRVDMIFHLAAAVGVGQSMYEISHYMGSNTQGTANLLQAMLDTKVKIEKLIVASSMSIYGEGKYLCRECGEVAPAPRTAEQLKAKQWETLCPVCGRELKPLATDESKPLQCTSIYALSKKDQEEMTLLFGRTYGVAGGGAALLQHLRNAAGAVESLHRRSGDLCVAAAEPPGSHDL